jgi:hypothetical protein
MIWRRFFWSSLKGIELRRRLRRPLHPLLLRLLLYHPLKIPRL